MGKKFEFQELTNEETELLLSAFDYEVDEKDEIIDKLLKEKVRSKITNKPLRIENASLLPGSLKVVDSHPIILSRYLREEIESGGR